MYLYMAWLEMSGFNHNIADCTVLLPDAAGALPPETTSTLEGHDGVLWSSFELIDRGVSITSVAYSTPALKIRSAGDHPPSCILSADVAPLSSRDCPGNALAVEGDALKPVSEN
jgi:hypothetical protein